MVDQPMYLLSLIYIKQLALQFTLNPMRFPPCSTPPLRYRIVERCDELFAVGCVLDPTVNKTTWVFTTAVNLGFQLIANSRYPFF